MECDEEENIMVFDLDYMQKEEVINGKSKEVMEYFSVDGESMYSLVSYQPLFLIMLEITQSLHKSSPCWAIWHARMLYLQNRLLTKNSGTLLKQITSLYKKAFADIEIC